MHALKKHLRHRHVVSLGVVVSLDSLLFMTSNPRNAPPLVLMAGFCLCIATMYYAARLGFAWLKLYGVPIGDHAKRLAAGFTAIAGSLLALQTMGQLSTRDIAILLPFVVLGYAYLRYTKSARQGLSST